MRTWTEALLTAALAVGFQAPPTVSALTASEEHRLTVVDGRTGEPLEGVEICWVEKAPAPRDDEFWDRVARNMEDAHRSPAEIEALISRTAQSARSDTKGRVFLSTTSWRAWLTGRKGALFGCNHTLESDAQGEERLLLFPDADLRVQALDAGGAPLRDIEVLLIVHSSGDIVAGVGAGTVVQRAATDSKGFATLAHALVSIAAEQAQGRAERWRVALGVLPSSAASVDLDPQAFPHDPITLRAPPTGEIEVDVREIDGSLAAVQFPLLLWERGGRESAIDARFLRPGRWLSPSGMRASSVNGKALFRNVGLGCEFVVQGVRHGTARVSETETAGPRTAGERVRVRLVLGEKTVVFRGRALDGAGKPLERARLRVEFLNDTSSSSSELRPFLPQGFSTRGRSRFECDEAGRFTLEFDPALSDAGSPRLVFSQLRDPEPAIEALADVGAIWSEGIHDLGDVRLALPPIVAAGRVLDLGGKPVVGVEVGSGSNLRASISTHTNALGEFVLRTAAPHDSFDLWASKPGFAFSSLTSVERGRSDLRVTLAEAARLTALLRLPGGTPPPETPPPRIHVRWKCVKRLDSGELLDQVGGGSGRDGLLQYEDCAPGTYRLIVTPQWSSGLATLVIDNIEVAPGETKELGTVELSKR